MSSHTPAPPRRKELAPAHATEAALRPPTVGWIESCLNQMVRRPRAHPGGAAEPGSAPRRTPRPARAIPLEPVSRPRDGAPALERRVTFDDVGHRMQPRAPRRRPAVGLEEASNAAAPFSPEPMAPLRSRPGRVNADRCTNAGYGLLMNWPPPASCQSSTTSEERSGTTWEGRVRISARASLMPRAPAGAPPFGSKLSGSGSLATGPRSAPRSVPMCRREICGFGPAQILVRNLRRILRAGPLPYGAARRIGARGGAGRARQS